MNGITPRRILAIGLSVVGVVMLLIFGGSIAETMDAEDILVVQSPWKGDLTWHTSAGVKWQGFGKVTFYKKRAIFDFDQSTEIDMPQLGPDGKPLGGGDGKPITKKVTTCKNGIEVRFNDGGHATMCGSIQYDMPLDAKHLSGIHTRFGSQEAVQRQLVETITRKSVYLSGPLMSSRESYAEKRSDLVFYVEDQVQSGVYKTRQREARIKDQLSGQEKSATVVEILIGKDGKPERQEEAVLSEFGIKAFNFTITRLPYDTEVENQIRQQQQIAMDVQTAIADARKAEQRAMTVEQQGRADAAKAKWDQEVIKAKAVTEAQQKLEVATLDAKAAEQFKRAEILRGEGEGTRRKLVMEADGALEPKLKAFIDINKAYAEAIKGYQGNWVPGVVMGGTPAAQAGSGAQTMIDLLTAHTARQLGVDMGVQGSTKTGGVPKK
ncbi:hypothetical protein A3B18_00875 [Candidatus Giovannonibacteria bacterium RIFCSPLOWO2_01_FULL_46_13]|uniref:Band 7 domain-containing protein n=1 Tax=Candidatus Giovannonibacteria bacterium RIFCSPLOWO2_01_FULL_46_13 TaxID=1798352 RepID=A0A1F5X3Q2_9BACT|nr:MAG: hypothetical protein A3B18_00875 [Candidatus Giovannonibacteria bacterium RIFCSPLOWO2_01_FULL_46_13]